MNDPHSTPRFGGAGRDRTDDLKLAKLPLSQLSYGPKVTSKGTSPACRSFAEAELWWSKGQLADATDEAGGFGVKTKLGGPGKI